MRSLMRFFASLAWLFPILPFCPLTPSYLCRILLCQYLHARVFFLQTHTESIENGVYWIRCWAWGQKGSMDPRYPCRWTNQCPLDFNVVCLQGATTITSFHCFCWTIIFWKLAKFRPRLGGYPGYINSLAWVVSSLCGLHLGENLGIFVQGVHYMGVIFFMDGRSHSMGNWDRFLNFLWLVDQGFRL